LKTKRLSEELKAHFPFTAFSAAAGIIIVAIITILLTSIQTLNEGGLNATDDDQDYVEGDISAESESLFHVFHPIHVLFSASATTAMFLRYEKKPLKAALVGFVSAIIFCTLSDIVMPYIGGVMFGMEMELHIDIIIHPQLIIPFVFFGIFLGLASANVFTDRVSTLTSHSSHVFISTMASILFLTSFGFTDWMDSVFIVFMIVVIAVLIPCCTSDIIFPLLFAKDGDMEHAGHSH
jgi:hypothetical protein